MNLLAFLPLCLFLFVGCARSQQEKDHLWIAHPSYDAAVYWKWEQIPSDVILPIQTKAIPIANDKLEKEQIIQLTTNEMRKLIGKDINVPHGSNAYLVRGVSVAGGHGEMTVRSKHPFLWVQYVATGERGELVNRPVVVILRQKPVYVFVGVSIAD